ncbi:MAG: DMT family transporter, partial [Microbacteriaceae bacterium]
ILAFTLGAQLPGVFNIAAAMLVGLGAYGVSLVLFIIAMRHVGTARTGAYYSIAPFFGAILAITLGDPISWPIIIAGILMAIGVWLHLTERHEHEHTHDAITHDHWHTHDEHHQHDHEPGQDIGATGWHKHAHTHEAITHTHEHYPDSHHRHTHDH